jgi:hypothetical protein
VSAAIGRLRGHLFVLSKTVRARKAALRGMCYSHRNADALWVRDRVERGGCVKGVQMMWKAVVSGFDFVSRVSFPLRNHIDGMTDSQSFDFLCLHERRLSEVGLGFVRHLFDATYEVIVLLCAEYVMPC